MSPARPQVGRLLVTTGVVASGAGTPKQDPLVSVLLRADLAQREPAPHGGVGTLLRDGDDT